LRWSALGADLPGTPLFLVALDASLFLVALDASFIADQG
jgi:hypothetical protein